MWYHQIDHLEQGLQPNSEQLLESSGPELAPKPEGMALDSDNLLTQA
jgi:hypothetical protein